MKCPECAQGKTQNCTGTAYDADRDEFEPCETTKTDWSEVTQHVVQLPLGWQHRG